jgi:hypothetical protein
VYGRYGTCNPRKREEESSNVVVVVVVVVLVLVLVLGSPRTKKYMTMSTETGTRRSISGFPNNL